MSHKLLAGFVGVLLMLVTAPGKSCSSATAGAQVEKYFAIRSSAFLLKFVAHTCLARSRHTKGSCPICLRAKLLFVQTRTAFFAVFESERAAKRVRQMRSTPSRSHSLSIRWHSKPAAHHQILPRAKVRWRGIICVLANACASK